MKGKGSITALVLIMALTMACGSENQGAGNREAGPGTIDVRPENRGDGKR